MAKRLLHAFDATTAFTLLRTALLPLGHCIHPSDLNTGAEQIFIHEKMRLVINFQEEIPFLQICSMNENVIIELRFEDYDIIVERSERRKSGYWQVPSDKSALDAEYLLYGIKETINQYIRDHYDLPVLETAHDIAKFSQGKR
ncbi:MAG: hypothetical protein DI628_02485 [Blastochloris viridis]|uniref:Uncharacterized protein n=1 Tax=Blastochloris viridis TaxID=1079 RepID=A0A6N4REJ4_BLAVI|nr:MAG: hypothetical protein DI628_02485 [Blastochloris viridis]